jgi:hypothetical protein
MDGTGPGVHGEAWLELCDQLVLISLYPVCFSTI